MVTRIAMFCALLSVLSLSLFASTTRAAGVLPSSDAARTVGISDLRVHEGSVTGTIVNRSPATLRGVELLLRQDWQWSNERHPGSESPGRSLPLTLAGDVAPNASAPFTFQIPRLPARSDGHFVTTMDVVNFTEVGP